MSRFRPDPEFKERLDKSAEADTGRRTNGGAGGRPAFEPQEWQFGIVINMAGLGIPLLDICTILEISENTFRKHFAEVFAQGKAQAKAVVAKKLMDQIMSGYFPAIQFYMKTQMGWAEAKPDEAPANPVEAMDDDDIRREIAALDARASVASKARSLAPRV